MPLYWPACTSSILLGVGLLLSGYGRDAWPVYLLRLILVQDIVAAAKIIFNHILMRCKSYLEASAKYHLFSIDEKADGFQRKSLLLEHIGDILPVNALCFAVQSQPSFSCDSLLSLCHFPYHKLMGFTCEYCIWNMRLPHFTNILKLYLNACTLLECTLVAGLKLLWVHLK